MQESPLEYDEEAFYAAAFPPPVLVDDPLRSSARAISQATAVAKTSPNSDGMPGVYGRPNRPTQGEVSAP